MYKRRDGWWEEYGFYIRKSPVADVWFVGFGGMGKRHGGPTWEFDSRQDAVDSVEEFVNTYWDIVIPDIVESAIEGGMPSGRRSGISREQQSFLDEYRRSEGER